MGLGGSGTGSSTTFFLFAESLAGDTEALFWSGFTDLDEDFGYGLAGLSAAFFIFRKLILQ